MIKQIIEQAFLLVKYVVNSNPFFYHSFPLLHAFEGKVAYVLVNGPSLKKALSDYDEGKLQFDDNTFVVNLFALDPHFLKIKPKHYCISDPMFLRDHGPKKEQVRKMYNILQNEVDWDMYLYICISTRRHCKQLIEYAKLSNPHIKMVFMNKKYCSELYKPVRHFLYKRGWFMPEDGTIANVAIYLALIEGYKEIKLYGADHNMFLELAVNDNNELCSFDSHFYENNVPKMKPFVNPTSPTGEIWRIHQFLYVLHVMFKSHYLLRSFADYMGARVINCTPGSMIDSYEREKTNNIE